MRTNLLYVFVLLTSCGPLGRDTEDSWDCMTRGRSCDGRATEGSSDTAGESTLGIPGPPGPTGAPGPAGTVGPRGETGQAGTNGSQGERGPKGDPGDAGSSCSVYRVSNGVVISCEDGTQVVLLDGEDGVDGQAGLPGRDGSDAPPTPYTITELVDPCGNQGQFDEVLMRLANGQLIAHYSGGGKEFLTVLGPGTYRTTDATRCEFTVDMDLNVINEHNY